MLPIRFALMAACLLLLDGMRMPMCNWDNIRWGMTVHQVQQAYPAGRFEDPFVKADSATIARSAALAGLIEPNSWVLVHFDYDSSDGANKVDYVEFVALGDFNDIAGKLKARFGDPVAGTMDERGCFDASGQRIVSDPSGVGHVLNICQGEATFVDRKRGNAIYLGRTATHDLFLKSDRFVSDQPYQTIRIGDLRACEECAKR